MEKTRKKISKENEAEVMFKSNRLCCVDQRRGDHIHHIDGDNSNSNFQNLALLCFDCHNEATITVSLRRKLTAATILKYRELHYKQIQSQRDNSIKKFSHPIQKLTSEDLLNAVKDGIILIEIEKLQLEYVNASKVEKCDILNKFEAFENHISPRVAYEALNFLVRITYGTWDNMQPDTAQQIYFLTIAFLRRQNSKSSKSEKLQLGIEALRISSNIFHDSVIHLRNLEIAQWALLLTKNVYWFSLTQKLNNLTQKSLENFNELEQHLKRPDRDDLVNANELLQIYKEDLKINSLTFAPLPQHLEVLTLRTK